MSTDTTEAMDARLAAIAALPLDERIVALEAIHSELRSTLDAPSAS